MTKKLTKKRLTGDKMLGTYLLLLLGLLTSMMHSNTGGMKTFLAMSAHSPGSLWPAPLGSL